MNSKNSEICSFCIKRPEFSYTMPELTVKTLSKIMRRRLFESPANEFGILMWEFQKQFTLPYFKMQCKSWKLPFHKAGIDDSISYYDLYYAIRNTNKPPIFSIY